MAIKGAVNLFNRLFPAAGYAASQRWFEHISTYDSGRDLLFMNYGYASPDLVPLEPEDEVHRYHIQLYERVVGAVELRGREVLEVGCGRGGGAAYVARYHRPACLVGVDLAANAIEFCNEFYDLDNLTFARGDAQALEFADGSFDAVLNVESSICYPQPERFFAEVVRVLRPGGYFLYADIRQQEELAEWAGQLAATGLELLEEEDMTVRVLRALDLDNERKQRLINERVPWLLRRTFNEFAGVKGTDFFYGAFARGEKVYKRFLFRK